jgi:membrane protease YdiL (CAAX protease family)
MFLERMDPKNPLILALLAILAVTLFFSVYYIFRIHKVILIRFFVSKPGPVFIYFIEKLVGFFLFGIIPFLLFNVLSGVKPSKTGLSAGSSGHYWYLLIIFLVFVSFVTFLSSGQKSIQEKYPQLRIECWSVKYSLISLSGWILYILGYEFFFRGILLFTCYRAFGFWASLLINIFLYSVAHLDQGVLMSLGAIPAGVIFCLLTLLTGSFLFAFLIHSLMAVTTEIFAIYRNPGLGIKLKREIT